MKLTCAIIDDEPLAFEQLHAHPVDVLFCDIQMPELNGMELTRMLPAQTRVVFTTAFSRYAVEGFRVNAIDYLLKPISYEDFLSAARKALSWFEMKVRAELPRQPEGADVSPNAGMQSATPHSLFVRCDSRLQQIELDDICYIEGLKDYVKIYVTGQQHPVVTLMTLKALEEQLPSDRFVRVHRSYIVQPQKIDSIERNRIVFGKEYIPISENYRQVFYDFLAAHSLIF